MGFVRASEPLDKGGATRFFTNTITRTNAIYRGVKRLGKASAVNPFLVINPFHAHGRFSCVKLEIEHRIWGKMEEFGVMTQEKSPQFSRAFLIQLSAREVGIKRDDSLLFLVTRTK